MGARRPGVVMGECGTKHRCQVLQGSGAVCAPLRERDLELDQNCASTAGRVSHPRRLSDGAGAQTPQRFVWELDLPLDEGRARGVWPSLREGVHQYTLCNDRNVCGESANISGVPGGGTEERVNAAPVVVGTGAQPGRITVHLGIMSDGLATESTQLAGRGGCSRRK
jgi:hypothetical protein